MEEIKGQQLGALLAEMLRETDKRAHGLHRVMHRVKDYDLQRRLEKIEADLADIRHTFAVAKRLTEQCFGERA